MSKRSSGGRVVLSGMLAIVAAAGAGLLTAALTLGPAKPPAPKAMPEVAYDPSMRTFPASEPVKVEIPAIQVRADVMSVGTTPTAELEVPDVIKQPMLAGWYRLGPTPGEAGSSVIVGHVDSESTGPAVFFNLGKLVPGDVISVLRKDGLLAVFKVNEVKLFPKTQFPHDRVYGEADTAQLRLITCGGELDKKNRNYLSNVVVFASLAA
ncbi:class F sortase [Catelliglobosispora koreensis]|uniref:class F sortase n=1 Tax=Catelliglobosispora koreensis TaxID=129052 RepID=UPI000477CE59|nr:class F sortase [Catelliglobosispora koreensis]